jgi:hypothetical protein
MDERRFVESLIAAVPEACEDIDEPLAYVALGSARAWIEEHALRITIVPPRATVRPEHADTVRRFWAFVEDEAVAGRGDDQLETLLQIECFEGVGWVEDVIEYVGPRTRELLVDAQDGLARFNGSIGRWGE